MAAETGGKKVGLREGGVFQKGISQEVDPEKWVVMGESKHLGPKLEMPAGGSWKDACWNGGSGCTTCPCLGGIST